MPATLTLKDIPDVLYQRLKQSAALHRRSLNSEAIICLEMVLVSVHVSPSERLVRTRVLRAELPVKKYEIGEIDAAKRQGRRWSWQESISWLSVSAGRSHGSGRSFV